MDDWMHGGVNLGVGCLLVVAWAYGKLIHARCPSAYRLTFTQLCIKSSIHRTIRPYTHPPQTSLPHPFIYTPIRSSTHTSIHIYPLIYPYIYIYTHSPTYPSNQTPIHPFIYPSIHSSIHPFTHPSIHPPIRSSIHPSP